MATTSLAIVVTSHATITLSHYLTNDVSHLSSWLCLVPTFSIQLIARWHAWFLIMVTNNVIVAILESEGAL